MNKPVLSLVLALYNEEQHLKESLGEIDRYLKDFRVPYELVLVEDASIDATLKIARQFASGRRYVSLVVHSKNEGRGKTVRDGMKLACGKVVGYIDVDLEVSPVFIRQMTEPILRKKADVTIGHRIYNTHLSTIPRFVLSRGYVELVRRVMGLNYHDTEAGYKFFNSKALAEAKKCKDKGWFFDTEVVIRCQRAGLIVEEVPVLFIRNPKKRSTVRLVRDSFRYLVNLYRFRMVH